MYSRGHWQLFGRGYCCRRKRLVVALVVEVGDMMSVVAGVLLKLYWLVKWLKDVSMVKFVVTFGVVFTLSVVYLVVVVMVIVLCTCPRRTRSNLTRKCTRSRRTYSCYSRHNSHSCTRSH
jgi:uncharacterized membrane protein